MKYKLVIFDMDGTLLNTLVDLYHSTNYALSYFDYPLRSIDEVRRFIGNGIYKLVERALPKHTNKDDIDKVYDVFKKHYDQHCLENTRPYDGIIELLEDLKAKNIKTAVVSNKADSAVKTLSHQHFHDLLDLSIGEREGIKRKPSPDSINEVIKELKISKDKVVYVGDSNVDIETADNAGIAKIIVSWGFRDYEELVKYNVDVVRNVEELKERLYGGEYDENNKNRTF